MKHWRHTSRLVLMGVCLGLSAHFYWCGDMSHASYWLVTAAIVDVDDLTRRR